MITVVGLNPAMDRTIVLNRLEPYRVNRSKHTYVTAGGKGLNVARAIRKLGGQCTVLGFAGGATGQFLCSELARLEIAALLTPTHGETRTCYILVDEPAGEATVINEPGPAISAGELAQARADFEAVVASTRLLVISGSAPPGVPPGFYADLISRARAAGIRTLVDTSGEPLVAAVQARPWLLKPNGDELNAMLGTRCSAPHEFRTPCAELSRRGVEHVVVTLGAAGCVWYHDGELWRLPTPAIPVKSAVGSGDAFLAGLAVALFRGRPLLAALRLASACGALNAASLAPDLPDGVDPDALAAGIEPVRL